MSLKIMVSLFVLVSPYTFFDDSHVKALFDWQSRYREVLLNLIEDA